MDPTLLDRELRAAFRTPRGSAERVVCRALEGEEGKRTSPWPRLHALAAALTLLLGSTAAHRLVEMRAETYGRSNVEPRHQRLVIISGSRPERSEILIIEHGGNVR